MCIYFCARRVCDECFIFVFVNFPKILRAVIAQTFPFAGGHEVCDVNENVSYRVFGLPSCVDTARNGSSSGRRWTDAVTFHNCRNPWYYFHQTCNRSLNNLMTPIAWRRRSNLLNAWHHLSGGVRAKAQQTRRQKKKERTKNKITYLENKK